MLARRRMLGTTLFGGLLGATIPAAAEAGGQTSDRQVTEVVDALREIRKALESQPQASFAEIAGVRQKQVDYLKATNKFPDFIDVGLDVWFAVHDWHIKHLQQMVLGRDSSGRYTITLLSTQLVMRPDLVPTFISAAYDNR
jgi:hypothetical protein